MTRRASSAPPQLAILSRSARLYSTRRLLEAARSRGLAARVLHPLHCVVALAGQGPELLYRGASLDLPAVVIPRIGASITVFGLALLRHLEAMGVAACNAADAVARARDKLRCLQLLVAAGLAIPPTALVRRRDELPAAIDRVGGPPVVLKLLDGSRGVGVMLAESVDSAQSVLDAMHWLKQDLLIQGYIQEARGADVRALVVGGRLIAAMERQAPVGQFRANLHRGGSARPHTPDPATARAAELATAALGLDVAGVDLLATAAGPLVLEVNASPGLEGIETTTGRDVAGAIVARAAELAREHQPSARSLAVP